MVRTTLNLDDQALSEAMKVSEDRTKTEVINEALRQFAQSRRRKRLLDLQGSMRWEGDTDELRKRTS